MDSVKFANTRRGLKKTRKQLSALLDVSPAAIRSYEKGWRYVPARIERQLLSLTSPRKREKGYQKPDRQLSGCSAEQRLACPAWELRIRQASWITNAGMFHGNVSDDLPEQVTVCRSCDMLQGML